MLRGGVVLVGLLFVNGCLFDSRALMQAQSQRNAAKAETPKLAPSERAPTDPNAFPAFRVRVYVARTYAAENPDTEARIARTFEDANAVLGASLSTKLEVVETRPWTAPDGELAEQLAALHRVDPGTDVDWVVGFTGSLSKLSVAFQEIGLAEILGQHFVMRGVNDAAEFDDIERRYTSLSTVEREKLYAARKRHKAALVLLHELGHTLGSPHAKDGRGVMTRVYDDDVTGYARAELDLLRVSLGHRRVPREDRDQRGLSRALRAVLKRHDGNWLPDERDSLVARLRTLDASPEEVAASSGPPPVATRLTGKERSLLERASRAAERNQLDEAWRLAEPLFEKHLGDHATQELRCRLAMRKNLEIDQVTEHCAAFQKLVPHL